ncbi:MAG: hypothetical protein ACI8RZ_004933, partial [Myxococcota bacterium]
MSRDLRRSPARDRKKANPLPIMEGVRRDFFYFEEASTGPPPEPT